MKNKLKRKNANRYAGLTCGITDKFLKGFRMMKRMVKLRDSSRDRYYNHKGVFIRMICWERTDYQKRGVKAINIQSIL